jgi:hypothetical protein
LFPVADFCLPTRLYRSEQAKIGKQKLAIPRSFAQKVRNATNGSWWMVQVQPTKANADQSCARSAPEERMKSLKKTGRKQI